MTIKGSLQGSIPIVKAFLAGFLVQNLAGSRALWIGGRWWPPIWIPWPRLAYSLYNFYVAKSNLGDNRFRGFWGSWVQISYFSIDLRCRPTVPACDIAMTKLL